MNGEPDAVAFGQTLRAARQRMGVSQEDIGMRVGIGPSMLGHFERGVRSPTPLFRRRLCDLFPELAAPPIAQKTSVETSAIGTDARPLGDEVHQVATPTNEPPASDASTDQGALDQNAAPPGAPYSVPPGPAGETEKPADETTVP